MVDEGRADGVSLMPSIVYDPSQWVEVRSGLVPSEVQPFHSVPLLSPSRSCPGLFWIVDLMVVSFPRTFPLPLLRTTLYIPRGRSLHSDTFGSSFTKCEVTTSLRDSRITTSYEEPNSSRYSPS